MLRQPINLADLHSYDAEHIDTLLEGLIVYDITHIWSFLATDHG